MNNNSKELLIRKRVMNLYCRNKPIREISRISGIGEEKIRKIIRDYDKDRVLRYRGSKFKEKLAIKMYVETNIFPNKIFRYLGISQRKFYMILNSEKVKKRDASTYRKYTLNHDYFSEIDEESKAYWLGFIIGDGSISKKNELKIALQSSDHDHLRKFLKSIGNNSTVKFSSKRNYCYCSVTSKKIKEDLEKYGVSQNKTWSTYLPIESMSKEMIRNCIRGIFDSDGSLIIPTDFGNGRSPVFSITGTEKILTQIQDIMIENLSLKRTTLKRRKKSFMLTYSGRLQCIKILEWLYQDSTISLKRKHDRYEYIRDFYVSRIKTL